MRNVLLKFLRYFLTGGLAAIVDAGGFALLYQLKVHTLAAAIASFSIAAMVNFSLTSKFVFRQRATATLFSLFLMAALGGLAVNVCVTLFTATFFQLDPRLAKVIGIGTAFFVNFMLNLHVVFRDKANAKMD
ncbi:putative flippase GtrA [Oxalobacteraceae bacterium GrIS 1.11]